MLGLVIGVMYYSSLLANYVYPGTPRQPERRALYRRRIIMSAVTMVAMNVLIILQAFHAVTNQLEERKRSIVFQ